MHPIETNAGKQSGSRRILAVVLPQLLCELVAGTTESKTSESGVWAVSLLDAQVDAQVDAQEKTQERAAAELQGKTVLDAVSSEARKYGVRPGQSIAEARALVAHLRVCEVPRAQVRLTLERICESVMRFGTTVAFELPDTVWVDITGVAHLFGDEASLAEELAETLLRQGHGCRVAVATGPVIAQALARWSVFPSNCRTLLVTEEEIRSRVAQLPTVALPVSSEVKVWLAQLGVLTFSDLVKIPPEYARSRLGSGGSAALSLVQGKDEQPLNAFVPVELPLEESVWEEPVSGAEPLLFALRGLTARLSERLEGRGVAAQRLRLSVIFDPVIARFRGVAALLEQDYELSTPLFRSEELWKVVSSRLSRTRFSAPSLGLKLQVLNLSPANQRQLDLSSVQSKLDPTNPEALAVLLGELAADVGHGKIGVLRVCDSHCPEKVSLLQPMNAKQLFAEKAGGRRKGRRKKEHGLAKTAGAGVLPAASEVKSSLGEGHPLLKVVRSQDENLMNGNNPSRLFVKPIPLNGPIRAGTLVPIGLQLFSIKQAKFEKRLQSVEWWSGTPVNRDYVRVWLENEDVGVEALLFVDRDTGQRFLQGVFD